MNFWRRAHETWPDKADFVAIDGKTSRRSHERLVRFVGRVVRDGDGETVRQFHISSFVDSPKKMARHIRNHWQVENCLHRVPDVTFRQDDCRIGKANAAANFATIDHAAINLLKRVPGKKMSLPQKRRSAAWDDDYMETIIRQ